MSLLDRGRPEFDPRSGHFFPLQNNHEMHDSLLRNHDGHQYVQSSYNSTTDFGVYVDRWDLPKLILQVPEPLLVVISFEKILVLSEIKT